MHQQVAPVSSRRLWVVSVFLIAFVQVVLGQTEAVHLGKGLVLTKTSRIVPSNYLLMGEREDIFKEPFGPEIICTPVIMIEGENIEIDFQ